MKYIFGLLALLGVVAFTALVLSAKHSDSKNFEYIKLNQSQYYSNQQGFIDAGYVCYSKYGDTFTCTR